MINLPDAKAIHDGKSEKARHRCEGWNACLAEVQHLNATAQPVSDDILKIADRLESRLWPNMGDGNRALIQAAIEVLRTLPVEYHVAYGFTLMPKEITLEMAEAAAPYHADCKQYYRALVAAAPGGQDD